MLTAIHVTSPPIITTKYPTQRPLASVQEPPERVETPTLSSKFKCVPKKLNILSPDFQRRVVSWNHGLPNAVPEGIASVFCGDNETSILIRLVPYPLASPFSINNTIFSGFIIENPNPFNCSVQGKIGKKSFTFNTPGGHIARHVFPAPAYVSNKGLSLKVACK